MSCGCRGGTRAGTTQRGVTVVGFEITYPDGSTEMFLTSLAAQAARRQAGGGTVRQITSAT